MCFIYEKSVWMVLHRQKNAKPNAFVEMLEATQLLGSESNIWKQKQLVFENTQGPINARFSF